MSVLKILLQQNQTDFSMKSNLIRPSSYKTDKNQNLNSSEKLEHFQT